MKMTDLFLAQLEREAAISRRALERVPDGKNDWKPHPKSMPFGYLAALVASMPNWIAMMIDREDLDLAAGQGRQEAVGGGSDLVKLLDQSAAAARSSLERTNDEHLLEHWKLLFSGKVLDDRPRHLHMADTFMHMAHHRGQLTVYLRLNDQPVPSIYGPTADEGFPGV